ncbi:hypothetical protein RhiirA4_428932 [Rhizophagus irregularis]|uniref:DUF8211 domain-containing protein n=1 Tax=Rhizophagus irregularis TaxID=588596 RepID=A0A2I1HEU1_9GLOM|nr:hypothetical protein RhiirA4_428932 [Rhizophagus irregularis]
MSSKNFSSEKKILKTPLQVSLKKFHVTKPNRAGLNKIYEIRRSRSFFFELADPNPGTTNIHLKIYTNDYQINTKPISYNNTSSFPNHKFQISCMLTHFFSLQRVIPRRVQQKYFDMIRKKLLDRKNIIESRASLVAQRNTSTKTFFNFSYKRYRFYFGIYIPCSFKETSNNPYTPPTCRIPSPFIMSNDRCACINHQKDLAKQNFFKNIKPKANKPIRQTTEDFIDNKASHANLLYHRWLSGQPKHHYSKRLGISFISSIHARDANSILKLGNKHMYRKVLSNLQRIFSPNLRTQQKQKKRFTRACRRIFSKMRLLPGRTAQHSDYLSIARKNKFIFLKNQYIKHPIRHLLYKKAFTEPNADDYPFLVPFFAKRGPNNNKVWKNINSLNKHLITTNSPIITPNPSNINEPFNPIPNMFIPVKYRNIIPKDPIYVDDRFITPGSREWFTYMYNLEISIREKEEIESQERRYRERLTIYEQNLLEDQVRLEKEEKEKLQEALFHGTSVKHLDARLERIASLMYSTDQFHDYIPRYLMKRKSRAEDGRTTKFLNKDLKKFLTKYDIRQETTIFNGQYEPLVVSDDTAALEHRVNKRNTNDNRNSFSLYIDTPSKRSRPAPINVYDSVEAGPSNTK